jgi:sugar lactone lactonase YvrE
VPRSSEIGVAVIGCGVVAQVMYLHRLRETPGVRVAALCDLSAAQARAVGERHGCAARAALIVPTRVDRGRRLRRVVLTALAVLVLGGCGLYQPCRATSVAVATGLTNPRGLARGPDGLLYVAEAGVEATGGRLSRVGADGAVTTLVDGLPHSVNAGTEDVGASGVAFRNGEVYLAIGEGSGDLGSSIVRLPPRGAPEKVADLARFELSRNPDDLGIESNPFALLYDTAHDRFLVTDAAGNALLAVTPGGDVSTVAVWREGIVPTGIALAPDGVYVALLGRFPHPAQNGRVDRVGHDGTVVTVTGRLSMPIGVGVATDGERFALEFASSMRTTPRLEFVPRTGRLLRIGRETEVVVEGLSYPTALLVEEDGVLVSLMGAMGGIGSGSIARITPCPPAA